MGTFRSFSSFLDNYFFWYIDNYFLDSTKMQQLSHYFSALGEIRVLDTSRPY